ncbi:MAG: NAD(P)H-dependent oxidoreductase subunit E [Deltaproteobacteria bacterium]|nr:NAD(P)H-dependent oxidoreductase subunit E [Deltaproteobacteria bacterium]
MKIQTAEDLVKAKEQGNKTLFPGTVRINVGMSTCCIAKGADVVLSALEYGLKSRNMNAELAKVGCTGLCHMEPTVEIQQPGKSKIIYGNVKEQDIHRLLDAVAAGSVVEDMAFARVDSEDHALVGEIKYQYSADEGGCASVRSVNDIEFLKAQRKVILRNAGSINPENIYEYIARDGYAALARALAMKPEAIIKDIIDAGLRGRGGGGFPAGLKWKACRESAGPEKYLICNVSEGEPGIGMHRSYLESDPHSVLEGLIIGGFAIGASTAYVYIRDNYRIALKRFQKAIADATELGLLGDNILGTSFSMAVKVKEGGGRFVCGEETALIACIEGRIGEPCQRPPFPVEKGLFSRPTCINNVETWANVPVIIAKGSAWYKKIGSDKSKGTKVLSLSGNITRAGMIEVAMGTSLKDVVHTIGGGIDGGKKLKSIQTGGPSGGVIPASLETLTVDYDSLKSAGTMLGSGGMVIMDETTDMVKIARYLTDFFVQESCGKCVPCREGVCRMCAMLDEIIAGRGTAHDLSLLQDMSETIISASACALGKTAPIPVLSSLKHFRDDYVAYIK